MLKRMMALIVALALMGSGASAQTQALNVLVIGVDSANGAERGRSDTMMLVRISPDTGEVHMVSFLRDLYVSIPGHGQSRLNAAYHYGGEALLKEVLETNFGVQIDRTVTMSFSVLADLVDALGGIEVEVSEMERKHVNSLLKDYQAQELEGSGLQRLNGIQALCFSRIRKLDSDFQRTSRQQQVIAAMLKQMMNLDRWTLFKLALQTIGKVETDLNLGDLTQLLPLVSQLGEINMHSAHVPFDGAYTDETVNGMMVLKPNLEQNRDRLAQFFTE